MKIFHCVNVFTLFIMIYPQGVLNCVLPRNTVMTLDSLVLRRLPNIPLLMSSGRQFIVTSTPPNGVGETAQITPLMRLKVGGGWRDVGGARGSHRIVGVISGVALRWRRQMSASARRRPLPHPLLAGQPINCTWTHRGDSRKKLFHTL